MFILDTDNFEHLTSEFIYLTLVHSLSSIHFERNSSSLRQAYIERKSANEVENISIFC